MRIGLLFIWATATAGLFIIYILFQVGLIVIAPVDTAVQDVMSSGAVASNWVDYYNNWIPKLGDFFGYASVASLISLLIYIVVNSARREQDEYPVGY